MKITKEELDQEYKVFKKLVIGYWFIRFLKDSERWFK